MKLIVYMIDGIAADYYQTDSGRLPHLASLEQRGFRVENLHAETLGTSLPGRTSMLTGVTADVNGVYGNLIWGGDSFRYATPDDVRVPTLPARAREAGKHVASIGAAMIRPEDVDMMIAPWWVRISLMQRARDAEPIPTDYAWSRVVSQPKPEHFIEACRAAGYPDEYPNGHIPSGEPSRAYFGFVADQMIADWVGIVASQTEAPDLIWAEYLMTDSVQHETGYKSELSHWATMQADSALGRILARLENAGVLDEWNIAVMSDHGHATVETALQPQVILPGVKVQCEGGSLLVAPRDEAELQMVTDKLAEYDVTPYPNDCVPPDLRDQVFVFMAPPRTSFENDNPNITTPTAPPKNISTHGFVPGDPGDDRFVLFAGPDVPQGKVSEADAVQVAPTLAKLLDLPTGDFPAQPLF